jgi:hypothetical protein
MSVKTELHYPGTIQLVNTPTVDYPGVKATFFWSIHSYNRFFQEGPGQAKPFIVVKAEPVPYLFGLLTGVMVHYTKQLAPEEEQDFHEVTRRIEFEMADIRTKRSEKKAEEQRVAKAATEEQARLALVGKKYEERVKHMRALDPSTSERKELEAALNAGDPETLYGSHTEAFKAGYVRGYEAGKDVE